MVITHSLSVGCRRMPAPLCSLIRWRGNRRRSAGHQRSECKVNSQLCLQDLPSPAWVYILLIYSKGFLSARACTRDCFYTKSFRKQSSKTSQPRYQRMCWGKLLMYADNLTASSELFVETPVFFHSLWVLLLIYLTKHSKYKKNKERYLGTTRKRTLKAYWR